jgi:hypothetical protein
MEKWINVTPNKGYNDGTVNISATKNTGRNTRNSIIYFSTPEGIRKNINVTQKGTDEFVSFGCIKEIIVEQKGGVLQLEGLTNSSLLTFKLGDGKLDINLPEEYNAGGSITSNGKKISLDPGGHDAFRFSIELTIPENIEKISIYRELLVIAYNKSNHTMLIRQSGDIE